MGIFFVYEQYFGLGGGDLGLSLTGLRIGPIDPVTKAAKIGLKAEVVKQDYSMGHQQTRVLKERMGFSGGFKIPEEYRKSKQKAKGLLAHKDQEEDLEATQQSAITKDEIFSQLNLGHSEAGIGIGRHGTNSKAALAKDLVEGIEKDLEKLRRQQENLQLRKTLALNGGQSIVEETNEEREREKALRLRGELENVGAYVIDASPKKILAMRHQASQLASTKNLDLDELEQMRYENERRLKELEEMYNNKRQNAGVGRIMREKMGFATKGSTSGSPKNRQQDDFDRDHDDDYEDDRKLTQSQKKKKSVRIVDEKENVFENNHAKQTSHFGKFNGTNRVSRQSAQGGLSHGHTDHHSKNISKSQKSPSRSQSAKRKKSESPIHYDSPRRKLYEAKFEKYIANKDVKHRQEKKLSNLQKDDFDRYTKGPESPAKSSKRFGQNRSGSRHHYDQDDLIPKDYDERLMVQKQLEDNKKQQSLKKDKFRQLNVSSEDKMTFFLLKWVFNAIKRDSEIDDPKLKGMSYVTKTDLVKQLSKNDELMQALGYSDSQDVSDGIRQSRCTKEGLLVWEEFLDFFFGRQSKIAGNGDNSDAWWKKIGQSETKDQSARDQDLQDDKQNTNKQQPPRYGQNQEAKTLQKIPFYEDPDKKPVKMTESLKHLQDIRAHKTAQDVEDEFRTLQDKKVVEQKALQNKTTSPSKKAQSKKGAVLPSYDYEMDDEDILQEQLGIKREKSKCLLLQSQIYIMQEIYDHLDKYKDKILRRSEFLMALRTDERVVEFIDQDAVQLPHISKKTLTLDDILAEIEKDEMYEIAQMGKNSQAINHKEFVTWREFMGYFNDYKDIEDRNRKLKELQKTRQSLQKERSQNAQNAQDQQPDINSLMDKEKQRRLQELPKLRPADQIDISEKQLQLLRDVFDLMPKVQNSNGQGDMINTIDFFIATRKNPQLRSLNSAIARDPDGYSRIPRETFQQVFDRMENEIQSKQLEWGTIVEYFTKRGRPLTKEEVQKLIDDDRQQREAEAAKKRADEDAERRRMARLMEDLEDKEDFEEFEMRQKSEQAVKNMQEKEFKRKITTEDDDRDESDNEIDRDYGEDSDYEHGQERGRRIHDDDYDSDENEGYMSDPEMRTAKRNYRFGEGGNSQRKNLSHSRRAQSAKRAGGKNFDERNLRNTKLTTKDYIDHDRSQSQKKKGKYGVTVPKPFGFDIRDKTKHKSIRERKVDEMVAEKRIKEQNILQHQFRSNPIPPEVLIPRYKSIIEANEMRRLEVKKNSMVLTKQKEMPFSFYERDKNKQMIDPEDHLPYDLKKPHFKANPIPRACSVLIFDQMMKKQEQEREERIRKQAELNFSKAKLPDRMQMHQEKVKQDQGQKSHKLLHDMGHSFKPKINELVTREQFEKQQQKFNQKLNKKKSQIQVTRPKSPNFTKKATKNLDREYLNEGESAQIAAMDKFKSALGKSLAQGKSQYGGTSQADKAAENPSSTISMKLGMEKRREEIEAKRKREADKKQEDKDRLEKQNRLKNVVQASLRDQIKDDKEKRLQDFEKKKQEKRELEKEFQQKKKEMEERVRGRPLLVERLYSGKNNSNLAKIKATEEYMKILKQNNLDPNDHLTEDQKDLMAEAQYIEKRKQEIGKF